MIGIARVHPSAPPESWVAVVAHAAVPARNIGCTGSSWASKVHRGILRYAEPQPTEHKD